MSLYELWPTFVFDDCSCNVKIYCTCVPFAHNRFYCNFWFDHLFESSKNVFIEYRWKKNNTIKERKLACVRMYVCVWILSLLFSCSCYVQFSFYTFIFVISRDSMKIYNVRTLYFHFFSIFFLFIIIIITIILFSMPFTFNR